MAESMAKDAPFEPVVRLSLRPDVPMHLLSCTRALLALGCVRALAGEEIDAKVAWPDGLVLDGAIAGQVEVHPRFDEGICLDAVFMGDPKQLSGFIQQLKEGMRETFASWQAAIKEAGVVAGPLAPVLADYFDVLWHAGDAVQAVFPNGRVACQGILAGVDVWGRVTLRLTDGQEVELAPEQAYLEAPSAQAS